MPKLEIWKGKELVSTFWDVAPEALEDEVKLTFPAGAEKYIVRIPKSELEEYCRKLELVI
jgi:hypothetical protein